MEGIVSIILIIGLLNFAKEAPQLLKDLLGKVGLFDGVDLNPKGQLKRGLTNAKGVVKSAANGIGNVAKSGYNGVKAIKNAPKNIKKKVGSVAGGAAGGIAGLRAGFRAGGLAGGARGLVAGGRVGYGHGTPSGVSGIAGASGRRAGEISAQNRSAYGRFNDQISSMNSALTSVTSSAIEKANKDKDKAKAEKEKFEQQRNQIEANHQSQVGNYISQRLSNSEEIKNAARKQWEDNHAAALSAAREAEKNNRQAAFNSELKEHLKNYKASRMDSYIKPDGTVEEYALYNDAEIAAETAKFKENYEKAHAGDKSIDEVVRKSLDEQFEFDFKNSDQWERNARMSVEQQARKEAEAIFKAEYETALDAVNSDIAKQENKIKDADAAIHAAKKDCLADETTRLQMVEQVKNLLGDTEDFGDFINGDFKESLEKVLKDGKMKDDIKNLINNAAGQNIAGESGSGVINDAILDNIAKDSEALYEVMNLINKASSRTNNNVKTQQTIGDVVMNVVAENNKKDEDKK